MPTRTAEKARNTVLGEKQRKALKGKKSDGNRETAGPSVPSPGKRGRKLLRLKGKKGGRN